LYFIDGVWYFIIIIIVVITIGGDDLINVLIILPWRVLVVLNVPIGVPLLWVVPTFVWCSLIVVRWLIVPAITS